jgi:universal bacterial protein YeaZ
MKKILAFDTASDACSVALLIGSEIKEFFEVVPKQHTGVVMSMVERLLNDAGLELSELDALAYSGGPGSFTGIRLSASLVQGFSFVTKAPILRISTLRVLAQEAFHCFGARQLVVANNAKRQEYYLGVYQADGELMQELQPDAVVKVSDDNQQQFKDFIGLGSALVTYGDLSKNLGLKQVLNAPQYSRASYVASLSLSELTNRTTTVKKILPNYLY